MGCSEGLVYDSTYLLPQLINSIPQIVMISILGSEEGVRRASAEGGDGIEIIVGGIDADLGGKNGGMIVPGSVELPLKLD
jgi:hypothetical protein